MIALSSLDNPFSLTLPPEKTLAHTRLSLVKQSRREQIYLHLTIASDQGTFLSLLLFFIIFLLKQMCQTGVHRRSEHQQPRER